MLLRSFSRKPVQSLCCYDYFQEKLCSHCGVMIIFKKNFEGKKILNVLSHVLHTAGLQSVKIHIADPAMWRVSCIYLVNGEIYFRSCTSVVFRSSNFLRPQLNRQHCLTRAQRPITVRCT